MIDIIQQPWPWYVSGILIGLMVPILLLFDNKHFGISSSLRHICTSLLPSKLSYFNYDLKEHRWNIIFVIGVIFGGILSSVFISPYDLPMEETTKSALQSLGINDFSGFFPSEWISFNSLLTVEGWIVMVLGGFLVGFGTRYADGCTSGHAIMGLSLLSPASLISVIGFFIGGLLVTHLFFPLLFGQ
jgi:uncharacterized membrane protein YedE/YeeE